MVMPQRAWDFFSPFNSTWWFRTAPWRLPQFHFLSALMNRSVGRDASRWVSDGYVLSTGFLQFLCAQITSPFIRANHGNSPILEIPAGSGLLCVRVPNRTLQLLIDQAEMQRGPWLQWCNDKRCTQTDTCKQFRLLTVVDVTDWRISLRQPIERQAATVQWTKERKIDSRWKRTFVTGKAEKDDDSWQFQSIRLMLRPRCLLLLPLEEFTPSIYGGLQVTAHAVSKVQGIYEIIQHMDFFFSFLYLVIVAELPEISAYFWPWKRCIIRPHDKYSGLWRAADEECGWISSSRRINEYISNFTTHGALVSISICRASESNGRVGSTSVSSFRTVRMKTMRRD